MTDLVSQLTSSQRAQLVATALASGITVATLIFGYQALERKDRLYELKKSIPTIDDKTLQSSKGITFTSSQSDLDRDDARVVALALRARTGDFDDSLVLEQLARNRVFLGDAGLSALRRSFVIVFGCGGVGSHCATALARSGVSRLRLVDFDQVTLSSLNRHAAATLADVGTPKVGCLERRLAAVAPWVRFDLCGDMFDESRADDMLAPWTLDALRGGEEAAPTFVVDAIDNVDSKVALLAQCHARRLSVVASMGAGCKADPTRLVVGDLAASTDDGLSRATRRRLKLRGVTGGITAVYSTERAGEGKAELLPLSEEQVAEGSVDDLGVMPNFRVRILPVLGTMPAVFGYALANHVIVTIGRYPGRAYAPAVRGREKMYDGILAALQGYEEKLARMLALDDKSSVENPPPADPAIGLKLPVTHGDVAFLVDEVYRGRSAVTGVASRLVLVRWRRPERTNVVYIHGGQGSAGEQRCSDVRLRDLVCMTREEAGRHEREVWRGRKPAEDIYPDDVLTRVRQRMAEGEEAEALRL